MRCRLNLFLPNRPPRGKKHLTHWRNPPKVARLTNRLRQPSFLPLVRLWLWVSVLASAAGWILSALGWLNRGGYVVFFALGGGLLWYWRQPLGLDFSRPALSWRKIRWRLRQPLPLGFVILASLIFLGGAVYPATNHTAFTYHVPRVLHWLAQGKWYWIHTPVSRMNHSGCNYEWLSAPLLLFTQSDRGLFLLNYVPYLLLPGLVFSVCTCLGVRARVAWQWMWLLPTGYNFLVQSGNAGNDVFGVVYALAMVHFGCRAWVSRQISDLWLCILAAALLTGVKISNAPLVLSAVILVCARLSLLRRHWAATLFILLLAATVSFLPSAVTNQYYCGDWLGVSIEVPHLEMQNPLIGIWGNAFQLLLDNFVPPFFIAAGWWNQHAPVILPQAMVGAALANFDSGFFWLGELPTEDWAGIGFGVSLLVAVLVVASFRVRKAGKLNASVAPPLPQRLRQCLLIAPWLALLVYCIKSGLVTAARLISPYYALLLPLLIVGAGPALVVRQRWWRVLAGAVVLLAMMVLAVVPSRPLWPAQTILSRLLKSHPGQPWLLRAQRVYSVYTGRSDPLACVRDLLPPDLSVVGFMGTADDIDISLWRPYGTRRVEHILLTDSPAQIRQRGIQYAVVGGYRLHQEGMTIDTWLQQSGAELVAGTNATLKVAEGPQPWYVVRFN